jgi:hypothetical protein
MHGKAAEETIVVAKVSARSIKSAFERGNAGRDDVPE